MASSFFSTSVHRRFNPLTGDWVLVSPHRTERPWDGQHEDAEISNAERYRPDCYLCPNNTRAGGETNPDYSETFVFTNDFAALRQHDRTLEGCDSDDLLRAEPETGMCRVICYSPRHDLTIPQMTQAQVCSIIETWISEYRQLSSLEDINHVQIFENRGLIMGCSNPHPHGQIWANKTVPVIPSREQAAQHSYLSAKGSCLLCDYLQRELAEAQRILFVNDHYVALVPFWATWPYETMILPRFHSGSISTLIPEQIDGLAEILISLGICYDNLFLTSFPYSMGIHQQPTDAKTYPEWHWHIHYLPPLLRSSSVKKHMVGYEMLAMVQRDLTPEAAAGRLQSLPTVHYGNRKMS